MARHPILEHLPPRIVRFRWEARARVTNRHNGRRVVVRINDRGPFIRRRIIDLTPAAAHQLGFSGVTLVSVEKLGR